MKKEMSLAEQRGDTVNRRYWILKLGYGERSNFFFASPKTETVSRYCDTEQVLHTHTNYTQNLMFYCMKNKIKSDKDD